MNYPDKGLVIDTLAEVARRVATEANAQHPDDLGVAMSFAIEYGAVTLSVLMERDLVKWRNDYTNPNTEPWWNQEKEETDVHE